jgi:integrase
MAHLTICNAVAEWEDDTPFHFKMREEVGPLDAREVRTITLDLSDLKAGFTNDFLIHLKEHLMERRHQVTISTIKSEASNIKSLLSKTISIELFSHKVSKIDEAFLLSLTSQKEHFSSQQLKYLRAAFTANPHSPLFSKDLVESDFPNPKPKKGEHGAQIDRILSKVLGRAAIAHILDICDTAYATGTMSLGHYSFTHLAFAVFVRPNSYRQIRVSDLTFDKTSNQYFIWITSSKSQEAIPTKLCFQINEPLGILLTKQRQSVIATYGHLVASAEIEKLALFPARLLKDGKSRWSSEYANKNYGAFENGTTFNASYPVAIGLKHFGSTQFDLKANTLRHTIGTLLAQTGASAKTIAAVLKHSSDRVCQAYVDIAFHGLIDELSKAIHPAFFEHLPDLLSFRSKAEKIPSQKIIRSEDITNGQIEEIGECGRDLACAHAPIVCYSCFRFRPCWDADHGINLKIVQREIDDMTRSGKPFEHLVEKAKIAKQQILIVMNAADRFRDEMRRRENT